MKRSPLAVTGSVLVAAWMSTGVVFAQSPEKINPDASGPKGGSRSERTGESDVPLCPREVRMLAPSSRAKAVA